MAEDRTRCSRLSVARLTHLGRTHLTVALLYCSTQPYIEPSQVLPASLPSAPLSLSCGQDIIQINSIHSWTWTGTGTVAAVIKPVIAFFIADVSCCFLYVVAAVIEYVV